MKQYKPTYFIGQAFSGLWRNGVMSFASIAVLMSCLVVLGSFSLLVANINENLESLGLMNKIIVFLEFDLPDEDVSRIEREIKSIPYVDADEVKYVSPDEGLENMIAQAAPEDRYLYDPYREDNPLSGSFEITYIDGEHYTDVTYNLSLIEGIRHMRDQRSLANTMQSLKNGIMMVFTWFLVVLFVVSVFVIINTVKLSVYSRKSEISIMRYVGATGIFISLPFVIEGALIGLISSMLAYVVEVFLYRYVETSMADIVNIISVMPLSDVKGFVFFGFAAVGVLTGIFGSTISLSKYTRN